MRIYDSSNAPTIRQLQVYAALCMRVFCTEVKISHSSIDELFRHLVSIATTENLAEWEQSGLKMDLIGRGDPIPEQLMSIIPKRHLDSFSQLVENSVEVGLVDMYGAPTEKPREFANRCVAILKKAEIQPPPIDEICKHGLGVDHWGAPMKETELEQILNHYSAK